jgi:calcium binding protein 39
MAFLFPRNKQKVTHDLIRTTKDLLIKLSSGDALTPASEEALAAKLADMKLLLQGTYDVASPTSTSPDQIHQLISLLLSEDILFLLASTIHLIPFEGRKDTQFIFSNVLRYKTSPDAPVMVLPYLLSQRPQVIIALCEGYDRRESAMPCGGILREALKFDAVAALILYDEPSARPRNLEEVDTSRPSTGQGVFWKFFEWIVKSSFDVCADAFSTFREILTKHKALVATFLETNFEEFFGKYNKMLVQSENYVTKRQSIKLLGELLLDRANYNVMTKYVDSSEHLKLCMKLLLDDRRMINYEGFHVFKVGSLDTRS